MRPIQERTGVRRDGSVGPRSQESSLRRSQSDRERFGSQSQSPGGQPAHSIEYTSGDPASRGPAGYGPIDPGWLPRRALAGTYDDRWNRTKKPLLPDDFDPAYALSSPADQRNAKPLAGGRTRRAGQYDSPVDHCFLSLPKLVAWISLRPSASGVSRMQASWPRCSSSRSNSACHSSGRARCEWPHLKWTISTRQRSSRGAQSEHGDRSDRDRGADTAGHDRGKHCGGRSRQHFGVRRISVRDGQRRTSDRVRRPTDRSALEGRARMAALIESVLDEVMQKLAQGAPHSGRCYFLLALPETRPGFSDADAAWVAQAAASRLETQLHDVRVSVSGRGHAGAMRAIQLIAQESARAADALFLIVGADSYHHPCRHSSGSSRIVVSPSPTIRSGFIPGEGAGVPGTVHERLYGRPGTSAPRDDRRRRSGARVIAPRQRDGFVRCGLTEAVLAATRDCSFPGTPWIPAYSDINGERYRSEEWGFLAMKTHAVWKSLEYEVARFLLG